MRPGRRLAWIAVGVLAAAAMAIALCTPSVERPLRVWHKWQSTDPPVVLDRPGGVPLEGRWWGRSNFKAWNVVELMRPDLETWPRTLTGPLDRFLGRPPRRDYVSYLPSAVSVSGDRATWTLFVRSDLRPGEGLTAEERELCGSWRYRKNAREIELELCADRTGRGSDGSCWTWLSAEGCLALEEGGTPPGDSAICDVATDRRSYLERGWSASTLAQRASGTRLDPATGPR